MLSTTWTLDSYCLVGVSVLPISLGAQTREDWAPGTIKKSNFNENEKVTKNKFAALPKAVKQVECDVG